MADDLDKLENCDPEDIGDVIEEIEESFGFRFDRKIELVTFGDLCDAVENHVPGEQMDGCTTQQAFYKVRKSIAITQRVDEKNITPGTSLHFLFPRKYRRLLANSFQHELGTRLDFMSMQSFFCLPLAILLLTSIVLLFISMKIAIILLFVFVAGIRIANMVPKELDVKTVGELVNLFVRTDYKTARRQTNSVNRKEIKPFIKKVFCERLALNPAYLTDDAKLWQ
jgi:hypothetical protein